MNLRNQSVMIGLGVICGLLGVAVARSSGAPDASAIQVALPSYFHAEREFVSTGPQFSQEGDVIAIVLGNGYRLAFDTEALHLSATSPTGVVIAENEAGKIIDGLKYVPGGLGKDVKDFSATFETTFKAATCLGESVTLEFTLLSDDGEESMLAWTLLPVRYTINGKAFDGVADQFLIMDDAHYLSRLYYHWRGPVGEDYNGARSFRFSCYPGDRKAYNEALFGHDQPKQNLADWGMYIDGGQLFHLIGLPNDKGSIFEFLDEPFHCRSGLRSSAANDAVDVYYQPYLGRITATYTTPLRIRMLTDEPLSSNLWMELTQFIKGKYQQDYNIPATEPRPMACIRNEWREEGFVNWARHMVPLMHDFGYRRIEIGWVWRLGQAPGTTEIYPRHSVWNGTELELKQHVQTDINATVTQAKGSLAGLTELVQMAHDANMEVYAWHQTAHGWQGSPDVKNHPEWLVWHMDGHTVHGWYKTHTRILPVVWYSLRSGWKDKTVSRLRALKEATGLDGLWLDVYGAGSTCSHITPVATYCMAERQEYIREIRETGLGVLTEGVSLACVDSYVIYDKDVASYREHPFVLTGACPFRTGGLIKYKELDLFKLAGYRSFPQDRANIWQVAEDPKERDTRRAYRAEVKYRNKCFNTISDTLGEVVGVLETVSGTQWVCTDGAALFFWEAGPVAISTPVDMQITEIVVPGESRVRHLRDCQREWRIDVPAQSVVLLKQRD